MIVPGKKSFGSLRDQRTIISGISKSLSSFGKGISNSNSIAFGIRKDLNKGNIEKRKAIATKTRLFNARRQAVLRREQEDVVEASQVSSISKVPPTKRIGSSTKGFLGRIMDVIGATLVGWAILNIPKIIQVVEDVSKRIEDVIGVLREWFENTREWFTQLTSDLDDKLNQLRNIFIDDDVTKIQQAESSINQSLDKMTRDAEEATSQIPTTKPNPDPKQSPDPKVDPGKFSGKTPGGEPSNLLSLIRSAEGGYGSTYSAHLKGFKRGGEDITQMTITQLVKYQNDYLDYQKSIGVPEDDRSAAVGAYQMLYPDEYVKDAGLSMDSKFTPQNQDKLALAFLAKRGLTAEKAAKDPSGFALGLAQGFAGIPVLEAMQGYVQQVERGQSYYEGDGINSSSKTVKPEVVESAIKEFGQSYTPNPNQSNRNLNTNFNAKRIPDRANNIASNNQPQTIQVPIPIQSPAPPPPPPQQVASQKSYSSNSSRGTSLNSFIFTELQYT